MTNIFYRLIAAYYNDGNIIYTSPLTIRKPSATWFYQKKEKTNTAECIMTIIWF